jgi:hypothetical protein
MPSRRDFLRSDSAEVRLGLGRRCRYQHSTAALRVGHDAEELLAFLARMQVQVRSRHLPQVTL